MTRARAAPPGPLVRAAPFSRLDARTLYALLRLRVDVFVVEQRCAYRELDDRDLEPGTRHLWIEQPAGTVAAYLRTLTEPSGAMRIGRVVTARPARGAGLADRLMRHAVANAGDRPIVLDAQVTVRAWYERLGFVVDGVEYLEEGIAHVPMRRTPPGADRGGRDR